MPTSARRLTDGLLPACVGDGVPDAPCFGGAASGGILFASSGKKRRLNLRFKIPSARPALRILLRCVPHVWGCFARGLRCSIVSAPAPLPLTFQNFRCILLLFGPSRTPAPTTSEEVCRSTRWGRRPRRPATGAKISTFCTVSGSGAEQQTMLSLGHGLPKIPLIGGKGSPETIRFLARFWYLFPRGKRYPSETGHADSMRHSPAGTPNSENNP